MPKNKVPNALKKEAITKHLKQIIPAVSDEEQEEINAEIGSPADFDETEFINLTEWIKDGGQL